MVVTSAPWLLTTAVLLGLRLFARSSGTTEFLMVEQTVTIVYALTVVLSAPMDVVLSRHASDRPSGPPIKNASGRPSRMRPASQALNCGVFMDLPVTSSATT